MNQESLKTFLTKIGIVGALSAVCGVAAADPFALQAVCHLTNTQAGQGQCQLTYFVSDTSIQTPAIVRKGQIRVDGVVVANYVNDSANPVAYAAGSVTGTTGVTCGTTHTVIAYVAEPQTLYLQVGSLLPVLCPTAP